MLNDKELKRIHKIIARNEAFMKRKHKLYDKGVKREVKRVCKVLIKENKHIKGYKPYPQDVYYYMSKYSQYPDKLEQIKKYMK